MLEKVPRVTLFPYGGGGGRRGREDVWRAGEQLPPQHVR